MGGERHGFRHVLRASPVPGPRDGGPARSIPGRAGLRPPLSDPPDRCASTGAGPAGLPCAVNTCTDPADRGGRAPVRALCPGRCRRGARRASGLRHRGFAGRGPGRSRSGPRPVGRACRWCGSAGCSRRGLQPVRRATASWAGARRLGPPASAGRRSAGSRTLMRPPFDLPTRPAAVVLHDPYSAALAAPVLAELDQ